MISEKKSKTSPKLSVATGRELHQLFREVFALHDVLLKIMDKGHEAAGLATPQCKILSVLSSNGSQTVPAIADAIGTSRQFVQKVCNSLVAANCLEFVPNPRHKRSKYAQITPEGHKVFDEFKTKEGEMIQSLLPGTSVEQTKQCAALLKHLRKNITL